jgi:hypothetical protein
MPIPRTDKIIDKGAFVAIGIAEDVANPVVTGLVERRVINNGFSRYCCRDICTGATGRSSTPVL